MTTRPEGAPPDAVAGAPRPRPPRLRPDAPRSRRPRRPSRAARLSITATTAALVVVGAALTPAADRVAALATDPVTGVLASLTGADASAASAASPPAPAVPGDPVPGDPVLDAGAGAAAAAPGPADPAPPAPAAPAAPADPAVVSREGTGELLVVPGSDAPPRDGTVRRYVVEVEEGLGVEPAGFARTVHETLNDPRSWAAEGLAFRRVTAAEAAEDAPAFRVTLASPDEVDRLCAPLRTNGRLSCFDGSRAVINVVRWLDGVDEHPDLTVYRQYVVNHEVGHALDRGHEACPGAGRLAPVMQQQSKQVAPCLPNAWPHPGRGEGPDGSNGSNGSAGSDTATD